MLAVISNSDIITFYHLFQFPTAKELSLQIIIESNGTLYGMEIMVPTIGKKEDSPGVTSKGKSR